MPLAGGRRRVHAHQGTLQYKLRLAPVESSSVNPLEVRAVAAAKVKKGVAVGQERRPTMGFFGSVRIQACQNGRRSAVRRDLIQRRSDIMSINYRPVPR